MGGSEYGPCPAELVAAIRTPTRSNGLREMEKQLLLVVLLMDDPFVKLKERL